MGSRPKAESRPTDAVAKAAAGVGRAIARLARHLGDEDEDVMNATLQALDHLGARAAVRAADRGPDVGAR